MKIVKNHEMLHQRIVNFSFIAPVFFVLLVALVNQLEASGVFELEILKIQQTDERTQKHENVNETLQPVTSISAADNFNHNLMQIQVCLKEAFTSKLEGPCTFGNSSITVSKSSASQQADEASTSHHDSPSSTSSKRKSDEQPSSNQVGSQMTNIVRILFTFRWTKAFTIILTAEELQESSLDKLDKQQKQKRLNPTEAINGTHLVDSLRASPAAAAAANSNHRLSGSRESPQIILDRHVSTENEVLPNLEMNPNKLWTSRFSRSLKSSISYRFRVYCSLNYYGDGCTTFCRARDDQFGHYNCSNTGQKVCMDGWHGLDCDRAKCRAGCNQQHGYCDKPDTCQCRPGWTGSRCDECLSYPGCRNGYCLSPWQCICQRNWGGVLCDQDLNYCGTHEPCKNNGTCQNVAPGKYKCHCPEGFTGVDCDINISSMAPAASLSDQLNAGCAVNPCLNGGICLGFNTFPPQDFFLLLENSPITDSSSSVSGAAEGSNNYTGGLFYRCQCPAGWSGDYCQWPTSSAPITSPLPINSTTELDTTIIQPNDTAFESSDLAREVQALNNLPLHVTAYIESNKQPSKVSASIMNMKHLISWVVIASVVGVFIAALTLFWCCLIAIEQNKFSFIQMNIIRNSNGDDYDEDGELGREGKPIISSTLRRVHNKLRDSFRRASRSKIKPETKLSIENVLRPPKPPPSYEESSYYYTTNKVTSNSLGSTGNNLHKSEVTIDLSSSETKQNLVITDSPEPISSSTFISELDGNEIVTSSAKLNCPRHGHLYRKELQKKNCVSAIQHPSYYHKRINLTSHHHAQKHYTTKANNNHHVDMN